MPSLLQGRTHTLVQVNLWGLPPFRVLGVHVHEKGVLDPVDMAAPSCDSCGGHWNPLRRDHGCMALHGHLRHAGDLCNCIQTDGQGRARISFHDDILDLRDSLLTPRGRSVVVHAYADDLGAKGLFLETRGGEQRVVRPCGDSQELREGKLNFVRYDDLLLGPTLARAYADAGGMLADRPSRVAMVKFLNEGSLKNGNAGKRIMCATILPVGGAGHDS